MGIIRQGILGGFRKKTGTVVGAYLRKQDVIRALPRKSSKPPTQAQKNQQIKFALVNIFLSWISNLIDLGFGNRNGTSTPMNQAVAYHLREAITGIAPNFAIDYKKVKFSSGKLSLPANIAANAVTAAKVDFVWKDNGLDDKYKDGRDMANVMVYNPAKKKFVTLMNAAPRSAEAFSLQLPLDFSGDSVHCYISFTSTLKKHLSSNSVYIVFLPLL